MLEAICEALGWEYGALWRVDRAAARLRCVATWHPRLLTFEPDVTVHRARWSVGACSVVLSAVGLVIGCLRSGSRWWETRSSVWSGLASGPLGPMPS